MRTLIADDDPIPRRMLEATLNRWGYEVVVAHDGEEAWQVLSGDHAPNLAILDWLMPGIDGVEICRRVRARTDRPYTYLLLLTSRDSKEDVVAGMDAGADDYLTKPFDPQELQVRLRAGRRILELEAALRQSLDALKNAQSRLVESEKMVGLGQMVAGVAHEINNPLAFVSNNVAVLQRDTLALRDIIQLYRTGGDALREAKPELADQIDEMSERIDIDYTLGNLQDLLTRSREGMKRIQQIVRDLRDFARLDESDLKEVDLNAGILSTVNILAGRARSKRVRIETELAPLPVVTAYGAKLNQVFMNLIANAVDASAEDGIVTVRSRQEGDELIVEVEDHGHGIPASLRDRIFDPFFTTKPVGEGTGLGLSISYGIVQDHGGRIEFESQPGKGARFFVHLPRGYLPHKQ